MFQERKENIIEKRNFIKASYISIIANLNTINWHEKLDTTKPTIENWNFFKKLIEDNIEHFVPIKNIIIDTKNFILNKIIENYAKHIRTIKIVHAKIIKKFIEFNKKFIEVK